MARINILRKNGTPTAYFWSDKDRADETRKTVYKQTSDGIKRMRGVHFNPSTRRIQKH
ncbi:MAG TPA: hypothetical protein VFZ56_11465 [Gemmatimonadaceae bacterium]|jgi:hypothetical protein